MNAKACNEGETTRFQIEAIVGVRSEERVLAGCLQHEDAIYDCQYPAGDARCPRSR